MLRAVSPLAIDLSARGTSVFQLGLAITLLVVFFATLTAFLWKLQYLGLEGDQSDHKRALRESKSQRDPVVERFSREEIEDLGRETRLAIRRAFEAAGGAEVETREYMSIRGALGAVRRTVRETWRESTSSVPGVALKAIERALLVAVFGAVAVSTSTVVQWITKDPDYPTAADIVAETQEYAGTGSSTLLEVLSYFPYSDLVWALAFTLAYQLGEWLFTHWYAVAAALAVSGVVIWLLESRSLENPRRTLLLSRRRTTKTLVAILGPTWLAGAVSTWVGELVGYRGLAEAVGFGLALIFFVVGVALALRRASLEALWTAIQREDPRGPLLVSWGLRHVVALLGPTALALVALYGLVGLADGSVARVVEAFVAADRGLQILVGLVALGAVALLVYAARDAYPAVREALVEALSRGAVRTVLLVRGVPFLAVVLAYLLAFGFNLPFSLAVVAGVLAGLLGRVAIVVALRLRASASVFGEWLEPDESALFVVVRAYQLEDADGTVRYYAEVNNTAVAADSIDDAVDEVLEASAGLLEEEASDPTLGEIYAEDLLEYGRVGYERARKKTIQRIREETEYQVQQRRGVSRSALERDLADEYPPELLESKLRDWIHSPGHPLRERDGYLYLSR